MFDETITLWVTRTRHDVVKAALVFKGCKFLRREWGAVVCHNGLGHSIFAKHLLQNLGGSTRVGVLSGSQETYCSSLLSGGG